MTTDRHLSPVTLRLAVAELVATLLFLPQLQRIVTGPYDSYAHIFFGSHYLLDWFAAIDFRWYTGFPITSYPPLAHQSLAAIATPLDAMFPRLQALEFAYILLAAALTLAFPLAIYAYARTLTTARRAATAALAGAAFSGWWTLLVAFGQLPTLMAVVLSLAAATTLDTHLKSPSRRTAALTVLLTAAVPMTHHFTVASFLPATIFVVLYRHARQPDTAFTAVIGRSLPVGVLAVALALAALFPFLDFLAAAPSQATIPHPSRQSWLQGDILARRQFALTMLAGLYMLLAAPAVTYLIATDSEVDARRPLLATVALTTVFAVLSLGYTTPLPRLLYDGIADTLTYFRFATWAGILLLPAVGVTLERVLDAADQRHLRTALLGVALVAVLLPQLVAATQIGTYATASPDRHQQAQEVAAVMTTGDHERWRYLALGMSQELGALAIQAPHAHTIDGYYNTGRATSPLDELKASGASQLAAAKYTPKGMHALKYYLAHRDEYGIKYIFSADSEYASTLEAHGYKVLYGEEWDWLGITTWYDPDVPPAYESTPPAVGNRAWYMYPWGVLPLTTLTAALAVWLAPRLATVRDSRVLPQVPGR